MKALAADKRDPLGDFDFVDPVDEFIDSINNEINWKLDALFDGVPDAFENIFDIVPGTTPVPGKNIFDKTD